MAFRLELAHGRCSTSRVPPVLQALNVLPRPPLTGELVPADYFREFSAAELSPSGHPVEVDLGCGDGSFLLEMARQFPEREFLGVERLLGRVRKVGKKIARAQLTNVRVLRLDSRYTVEWLLPANSLSRLHLLCPDPWPKDRHHRRRLIQTRFLDAIERVLQPYGEFLFMTDHPGYFAWAQEIITHHARFEQLEWHEESFYYPKTDFQTQWETEGKTMHRLRCRKPH